MSVCLIQIHLLDWSNDSDVIFSLSHNFIKVSPICFCVFLRPEFSFSKLLVQLPRHLVTCTHHLNLCRHPQVNCNRYSTIKIYTNINPVWCTILHIESCASLLKDMVVKQKSKPFARLLTILLIKNDTSSVLVILNSELINIYDINWAILLWMQVIRNVLHKFPT